MEKLGYVYVAESGDFIKIGYSTNPRARIINNRVCDTLKPGKKIPMPLGILAKCGTRQDEKSLHLAMKRYRVTGEWYTREVLTDAHFLAFGFLPFNQLIPLPPWWNNLNVAPSKISAVMSMLARRRSKAQRKGGPKLKPNRCPCGKYTKHTASLRNHKCEEKSS